MYEIRYLAAKLVDVNVEFFLILLYRILIRRSAKENLYGLPTENEVNNKP